MKKSVAMLSVAGLLGACASTPDVTYTYYLAKSATAVSVTQNITCSDNKHPVVSYSAPTVSTAILADFSRHDTISPHDLDSTFADNSFTMSFTNDGRLKTANGTWTGQGQTILQSAITLGTTIAAFGGSHNPAPAKPPKKGKGKKPPPPPTACQIIAAAAPDGKTLSFVYSNADAPADLGSNGNDYPLGLASGSKASDILTSLREAGMESALPLASDFTVHVDRDLSKEQLIATNGGAARYPGHLTLQKVAQVRFAIMVKGATLGTGYAVVPRTDRNDDTYTVPVTRATPFGTQSFTLTPSEDGSGSVGTSSYGDNAGTATSNVITVINSGLTAAKPSN